MKNIFRSLSPYLDRFEEGGLGSREFTALFDVDRGSSAELPRILRDLDRRNPSPYLEVPGLHDARWVLLNQVDEALSDSQTAVPSGPLIFAMAYDGNLDDVLSALVDHTKNELHDVLRHCAGFDPSGASAEWVRYVKAARVPSQYYFRDRPAPRVEIEEALRIREAFTQFFTENQTVDDVRVLRDAFNRFRRGVWVSKTPARSASIHKGLGIGYPFSLTRPLEAAIARETYWARYAAELSRRQQERDARSAETAPLRVAHAKHHGCLEATFVVRSDLDPRYQHGIFLPGSRYEALIRLSNASNRRQSDARGDARGFAIKLLDVGERGQLALDPPPPNGLPRERETITQDFLLVSHPCFFLKDIRDFAVLRSILDVGEWHEKALRAGVFFARRPRELYLFWQMVRRKIDHPLAIEYHSATAYLLGRDTAVKYSVRLKGDPQGLIDGPPDRTDPDYLRTALQKTLNRRTGKTVELEFSIHVPRAGSLPIEDGRADWGEAAKRVVVATLTIEPQDFVTDEKMAACERLVFTPWHALAAHKPLGSLNRGRSVVYAASAEGRGALERSARTSFIGSKSGDPPEGEGMRTAAPQGGRWTVARSRRDAAWWGAR